MSCQEEVLKIGKKLEKMISSKNVDDSTVLDLLNALKKQPMTLEVLQKTRIGMTVNVLRKQCSSDDAITLAKALIKNWKKLLPDSGSQSSKSSDSSQKSSSAAGSSRPTCDDDDSSRGSQPPADVPADNVSQRSDSSRDSEPSAAVQPAFTADTVRLKCREMLANAMRTPCDVSDLSEVDAIAGAIEDCIFKEFMNTEIKYKNRIRSRVSNLKDAKNPRLRENVILGIITPARIAAMTPDEMASDEMKMLRAKLTKEAIDDHQMATQGGTKSEFFKCGRCGQRDTMYNQVQTRSADEPMTTFVLCNVCGNRWKFC